MLRKKKLIEKEVFVKVSNSIEVKVKKANREVVDNLIQPEPICELIEESIEVEYERSGIEVEDVDVGEESIEVEYERSGVEVEDLDVG